MNTKAMPRDKRPSKSAASLLKQERERQGWTQSELAKRIGTSQVNVSRWEKGATLPGPYYRQKLGKLFGKTLEELGFVLETEYEGDEEAHMFVISPTPPTQSVHLAHVPVWNVPYRRNPFFTGREEILAQVYNALNRNKAAALTQAQAISGLGGIGKTQIAIEYTYRYRDHYQAILWVTASSVDMLTADFVMLADLLNLQEKHERDQDIVVRAVKRWLVTNENWLLILDNVDDVQMVVDFLPMQDTGNILLTTRQQALGSIAQGIEVEKMAVEEGAMFLLRRTKSLSPNVLHGQSVRERQALVEEIVTALDGLPLALDQAGAYIEETRCDFSSYLNLYRTRRKELLLRRGRLPADHPQPVAATWSLSFQKVEQESPAAADLLRLFVFLSPEAIPEEIITKGANELGSTFSTVAGDPLRLNEAIEVLLRYSLLRRNPETKFLSIHRLVQAVLKDGMKQDAQQLWAERAIRATNAAFPDVKQETWSQCQRCLSHAQMSASYIEEYKLDFPEAARLLNQAANYLSTHGQYAQAEPLLQQALSIRQRLLEPNHLDTASTLNDLGALYLTEGKYQQSEPLLQQSLEIRERELGVKHPDTATSLNYLALLYRSKGEYRRAEKYYQRALNIQEEILGQNHPDVAQTLNNMARLYRAQGEYAKSEPLYQRALDIRETLFGPDHLQVAQSLYSMAKLYNSQGKYLKAEEFAERAMQIQEQRLGVSHPDVANTLAVLAKIYQGQQKLVKAIQLNRRALAIRESISGENHPHVALIINNLAEIYHEQGNCSEAEPLVARSLRIHEQLLGPDHPYIAYSFSNQAQNSMLKGDYAQAEDYFKKAQIIRERNLGPEHPRTASTYFSLARLYTVQGRYKEAESLYHKTLAIRKKVLGPEHSAVATTLEQYANLLRETGRENQAYELEVHAQKIRANNIKPEGP
jgi:tetratricopeptide (TPR) repeat protein